MIQLFALAAAVAASDPQPRAAFDTRSYRYEASEIVGGVPQTRYRVTFDLLTARDGAIDAVVRSAEHATGASAWESVAVSKACRTLMHAPDGALAKVHLFPALEGDDALGFKFLDSCAPSALFYPLTDIVNVWLIPVSPSFKAGELRNAGDQARFAGSFNRYGRKLHEEVAGGTISLISYDGDREIVKWAPDLAQLQVTEAGTPSGPLTMRGNERWAFKVTLNRQTRALIAAEAIDDQIDMVPDLPGVPVGRGPHIIIKRVVTIAPEGG